MNELADNQTVSLNTVEDFEKFKKHMAEEGTPTVVYAGSIETKTLCEMSGHLVMTPTEMKDPDGEVVSIKHLNLVLCGSLADDLALPAMNPENMRDFAVAVARSATYTQRHLPIWQKLSLIWNLFCELFFGKSAVSCDSEDPYFMVAYQWYRKQQIPTPIKERMKIFWHRIRDMFVHTPDSEPIDTYGMPGFQTYKPHFRKPPCSA